MIWWVAIGGAAGSVARYLLGGLIQERSGSSFPLGTLAVNVIGAVLIGLVMEYSLTNAATPRELRVLLVTGFCGGFTTFSAFSWETVQLIREGSLSRAAVYVAASVALTLLATLAGIGLGARLPGWRAG